MSACDTCKHPGRCCRGFSLSSITPEIAPNKETCSFELKRHISYMNEKGDSEFVPSDILNKFSTEDILSLLEEKGMTCIKVGLPFIPLDIITVDKMYWRFMCPNLKDGRCADYENRPSICRVFKAGEESVCKGV